MPPQLNNDKARKQFELVLLNQPLVTEVMQHFHQTLGANLNREQAEALDLALGQTESGRISLTDIRGLGVATTQKARQIADSLVQQQLLQVVSDTLFEVPETLRQRFNEAPAVSAGGNPPQVTPQALAFLHKVAGEMTRQELIESVGLKDRKSFARLYLQPALDAELIEMTIPDKPRSSKQRYRLTAKGLALQGKQQ